MINRKFGYENEVSCWKLAVLKKPASSEKVALAKEYSCLENAGSLIIATSKKVTVVSK